MYDLGWMRALIPSLIWMKQYQLSSVFCKRIEEAATVYTCMHMHSNSQACTNISFSLLQCYQLEARCCVTLQYMRWAVIASNTSVAKKCRKNPAGSREARMQSSTHPTLELSCVLGRHTYSKYTLKHTILLVAQALFYLIWL